MSRRRGLMAGAQYVAPGYRKLSYLTCNGAYASTNAISVPINYTVQTVCMPTAAADVNRNATGGGTTNYYIGYCNQYTDGTIGGSYGTNRIKHDHGSVLNQMITVRYTMLASVFEVVTEANGITLTSQETRGSEANVSPVRIGWLGLSNQAFNGRIYRYSCTSSGGVARWDFVPAVRESDGAVGMYDLVSGLFVVSDTSIPFGGA